MRYVARQAGKLVVVLFAVSLLTFTMLFVLSKNKNTGGKNQIALNIAGVGANDAQLKAVEKEYGLDRPIPVQYAKWAGKMLTGKLGVSYTYNTRISELIKARLPVSLWLALYAQLIALGIAIPMGIYAAYKANGPFDRIASTASFGLLSLPSFITAAILIVLFVAHWKIFPAVSRYVSPFDSLTEHFKQFFLPSLSIGLGQVAVYMRLLRSDMVATLQNDFITMARAKGMPTRNLLFRHALRPSTFSIITAAGVNIGGLIGGTVIIEQIFALPGIGNLTIDAIFRRDLLVVQTCVVIFALAFVLANFSVDLAYAWIDPRIRHARALA